jgi:hypothetical protein
MAQASIIIIEAGAAAMLATNQSNIQKEKLNNEGPNKHQGRL